MRRELTDAGVVSSRRRLVHETLEDYYVQIREPKPGISKATLRRDQTVMATIVAFFGNRRTADLTVQDCDALLVALAQGEGSASGGPVSAEYLRRTRSFLRSAITNDMRLGYITRNVADIAVVPSTTAKPKSRRALAVEEWLRLYLMATGPTKLVVDLAGRHGLRPQEVRSVRWSGVDFDRRTLSIVTQLDSDDRHVDPKTVKSTRTIKLHEETLELLSGWKIRQAAARDDSKGRRLDPGPGLIVATRLGTPINRNNQLRSIKKLCEKTAVPTVTVYELRHTAITHQVEAGHPVAHVADWAGTSEKMIYEHYRHQIRDVVSLAPPTYTAG
ncbi:MAG: site-specific integrase [Acidimicrobiales bacterium]